MSEAATDGLWVISSGHQPADDVFGVWAGKADPALPAEVGAAWQVDLPANITEARQLLIQQTGQLRAAQQAIPAAHAQLNRDISDVRFGSGASFLANAGVSIAADDPRELLAAAVRYEVTGQSFALWDRFPLSREAVNAVGERLAGFADQIQRMTGLLAMVDTRSSGDWIASSQIEWAGNIDTRWQPGADAAWRSLHAAALENVLRTRQNWLRFFLTVTAGAARVGTALASGPFSLVAIWAAWNYLQAVIESYQRLQPQPLR